eukprot:1548188-Pyramimonas_sp.AAC.1
MDKYTPKFDHASKRATSLPEICGPKHCALMLLKSSDYAARRNSTTGIYQWLSTVSKRARRSDGAPRGHGRAADSQQPP